MSTEMSTETEKAIVKEQIAIVCKEQTEHARKRYENARIAQQEANERVDKTYHDLEVAITLADEVDRFKAELKMSMKQANALEDDVCTLSDDEKKQKYEKMVEFVRKQHDRLLEAINQAQLRDHMCTVSIHCGNIKTTQYIPIDVVRDKWLTSNEKDFLKKINVCDN